MAGKKSFDREKMYRKIMPTYYDNTEAAIEYEEEEEESSRPELNVVPFNPKGDMTGEEMNSALLKNKEISRIIDRDDKVVLYNLTEKLVLEKLDKVLDSMKCCKCDRCKMDIIAMALNSLEPHYVVKSRGVIEDKELEQEITQEATSAVLKAALSVRRKPRH
ncbi:MAG: late competence development ComFB family protein [Oscillospiraceae bacterium]